jgi:hypothetical protein
MKKLLGLMIALQLILLSPAMAQSDGEEGDEEFMKNTQNDITLVLVAGGAGAILGLSTLSFVEEPSRHLRNIWSGAAIGIIAGVIYVAYNSAQRGTEELQSSQDFNTFERVAWHEKNTPHLVLPQVQFGTQFWQMNF